MLEFCHDPLIAALSASASAKRSEVVASTSCSDLHCDVPAQLLWPAWALFGVNAIFVLHAVELESLLGTTLGVIGMDVGWRRDSKHALELWSAICGSLSPVTFTEGAALAAQRNVTSAPQGSPGSWGYRQLATLVHCVSISAKAGGARAILLEVEAFVQSWGWLKVAGGAKAELLEMAPGPRCRSAQGLAVEFGCLVGYTALRLAKQGLMVSLEVDAVHAHLARLLCSSARTRPESLEAWIGQARDLVRRLTEERGQVAAEFAFLDHRGTIFHKDLARLSLSLVGAPCARAAADNVLKPGAPLFVWQGCASKGALAIFWSIPEYLHVNSEDWIALQDLW